MTCCFFKNDERRVICILCADYIIIIISSSSINIIIITIILFIFIAIAVTIIIDNNNNTKCLFGMAYLRGISTYLIV